MYYLSKENLSSEVLTGSSKLVLMFLSEAIKINPQVSYETIASAVGITRMSAIRCIQQLTKEGLLSSTKDSKGWLMYELTEVAI